MRLDEPKVDCYLHLLILLYLLDHDGSGTMECAEDLMKKIVVQVSNIKLNSLRNDQILKCICRVDPISKSSKLVSSPQNRRSLDHIAARCYYYYMRAHEKAGDLHKIRGLLHSRLRTAALRNDSEGQAVLINCLLRSYIDHALFDQGRL